MKRAIALQGVRPLQLVLYLVLTAAAALIVKIATRHRESSVYRKPASRQASGWQAPDSSSVPEGSAGELVRYGKKLVANTAFYLGPRGRVAPITNGMNCQNCHLDAGTRLYGNNYSAVSATYPQFRPRSGSVEDVYKRINDCLGRSLNGRHLDSNSREMQAFRAYILWLGQNVPRHIKPAGAGITDIPFQNRASDTAHGRLLYRQQCQRCHGSVGEGVIKADSSGYIYPPLWGAHSYTVSAGLYRLSRLAGFVKDNMPLGASHEAPQLSDEQAWDIAAFINSQSRPQKRYKNDWPDISGKPIDYPFGPYADSFSEQQHKYGPFEPIRLARLQKKGSNQKNYKP